jgi:hypothetical protein
MEGRDVGHVERDGGRDRRARRSSARMSSMMAVAWPAAAFRSPPGTAAARVRRCAVATIRQLHAGDRAAVQAMPQGRPACRRARIRVPSDGADNTHGVHDANLENLA